MDKCSNMTESSRDCVRESRQRWRIFAEWVGLEAFGFVSSMTDRIAKGERTSMLWNTVKMMQGGQTLPYSDKCRFIDEFILQSFVS